MKRRIFSSILLLSVLSVILSAAAICTVFYRQLSFAAQSDVRERAHMLAFSIGPDEYAALPVSDVRLTIIARDGTVLHDNYPGAQALQNHADREEFREALALGEGESRRFSDTLGQETYYCAVRLPDGCVLRASKTMRSIWGMFGGALPVVAAVLLLVILAGYVLSGRLTARIIEPINRVDPYGELFAPYDELAPFVRTIGEQRQRIGRQLHELRERGDTMQAIMESMGEGIIILNEKGVVLTLNSSAEAFFALPEDAGGKTILELFRDVAFSRGVRDALLGTRGETAMAHGSRTFRVYFCPVPGIGAIILFMDVTERAREEALRREFSANVSHELKTPLTTIYGNAEMLAGGMIRDEDKPPVYDRIQAEAARMIALIEDIIMISRLDEGVEPGALCLVELSSVAREALEALAQRAKESGVSVAVDAQEAHMRANRSQMYELIYNLIDNAIKYNRPGGSVRVSISESGGRIALAVEDTGIGIPEEAQGRIFERFYRVDKSRSKLTGGTGLGLAIVKHIAMAYGGKPELHSRVGEGTTIRIDFPAQA